MLIAAAAATPIFAAEMMADDVFAFFRLSPPMIADIAMLAIFFFLFFRYFISDDRLFSSYFYFRRHAMPHFLRYYTS
jgi:hypothetical protein